MSYRDPDRKDRPSTSKFADCGKCKAKYRYELAAPEWIEPNEYASYGTEVHKLWSPLRDEEKIPEAIARVLNSADKQVAEQIGQIEQMVKASPIETYTEQRIWFPADSYSGRPDRIYIFGDKARTAFIPDLKSLWGNVEPPAANAQLDGTVPLVSRNFGSERAVTAIIQPNRQWMAPAFYEEKEIAQAEIRSLTLVKEIDVDDPVPTPGPWCGRCNARLWCKAALSLPELQARITPNAALLMPLLPNRTLEEVVFWGKAAGKVSKEAEKELKKRIKVNPDDFEMYATETTGSESKVGDLQTVMEVVMEMLGVRPEDPEFKTFVAEYRACMALSLPALAIVIARRAGMSQDGARKALDQKLMLRNLLTYVPKDVKLVEKK